MDPTVEQSGNLKSDGGHPSDQPPHPKLETKEAVEPPPLPAVHPVPDASASPVSKEPVVACQSRSTPPSDHLPPAQEAPNLTADGTPRGPAESNPYVTPAPAQATSSKSTVDTVKNVLSRWGKKVGEATKKAEDLSKNTWQHLKTGQSLADAAMGRIAQGTKVIAEGGYDKIFQQTFGTLSDEQLRKSYACYLSTSAGPVMGIMYLSTARVAFCSDSPLSYKIGDKTEWSYYKVVIPLNQLRAANPSISKVNSAEKYIQIVSIDNHEFWFMGFVNYDSAVKNIQQALLNIQNPQPQ